MFLYFDPYNVSFTPISYINIPENLKISTDGGRLNMKSIVYTHTSFMPIFLPYNSESLKDVVLMNGDTTLYWIAGNYKTIEIPKSVNNVSALAFANSNNLETIIVRNETLPSGFEENWNCIDWDGNTCKKKATVLLWP